MMENNNTMISSVYGNLADQDFDIFNHIEKAKMAPTNSGTDPFPHKVQTHLYQGIAQQT